MNWQAGLYLVAVLVPLAAFAIELVFIRWLKRWNAAVATGAVAFSCLLALAGFVDYFAIEAVGVSTSRPEIPPTLWKAETTWTVIGGLAVEQDPVVTEPAPGLALPLTLAIDNLSAIMFLMVSFVSTLIHVYSIGFMRDDPRFPRYFAFLSLFTFSMLGLVAAGDLFTLFLFWELVGVSSYLMIGFWYEDETASAAANKAYIVNRIGDLGMILAMGLLWTHLGTLGFDELNHGLRDRAWGFNSVIDREGIEMVELRDPATNQVRTDPVEGAPRRIPLWLLGVAGLGVFAGCVGKSAQFPLHVWLPDAMAGPTPVSALIHAATMVAAGVYLVGRFFPLFTDAVLVVIAYTGGITMLIAATTALVQVDYKKVLAYSTVSQLGFMMLALGAGGWSAGLFHLLTHAFFKALLFLCAGGVYLGVHTYDMRGLGGLRKTMPVTAGAMLVGGLAIAGVPFFSGFYSKDAILAVVFERAAESPGHFLLAAFALAGPVLTALYMTRTWLLIFAGESRSALGSDDPVALARESPPVMIRPMLVLAVCSVFSGWTILLGLPFGSRPVLETLLDPGAPAGAIRGDAFRGPALAASLAVMALGVGLGLLYYAPRGLPFFIATRWSPEQTRARFPTLHRFLFNKWYFDELYAVIFIRPCLALARICAEFDQSLVDRTVDGAAAAVRRFSRLQGALDRIVVDRAVDLAARGVSRAGDLSRLLQTGRLRNYLMFLTIALVGLLAGALVWVGG